MKKLIPLSLTAAGLPGCMEMHEKHESLHEAIATGHPGGAYEPRNVAQYDLENHNSFVLLDKGAQHSITHAGFQARTTDEGRMEVAANIRNRENRRLQVQVQCVFKDENGFSTGDETPWQNLILSENSQETVKFISMNNRAKRFTVRVQEAR